MKEGPFRIFADAILFYMVVLEVSDVGQTDSVPRTRTTNTIVCDDSSQSVEFSQGCAKGTMKPINQQSKGGRMNPSNDEPNDRPRQFPSHSSYSLKSPATKSLLKFRQRQELQRSLKARQYKSYKRVMKQEGFDVSSGRRKSRQSDVAMGAEHLDGSLEMEVRLPKSQVVFAEGNISENYSVETKPFDVAGQRHCDSEPPSEIPINGSRKRWSCDNAVGNKAYSSQKKHRTTRIHQQKLKENEYLERQERMEQEKGRKLLERRQRHKLLSARTPRGQPIMNNIVQDILSKLQNEKATEDK
jgi:rRNA processing